MESVIYKDNAVCNRKRNFCCEVKDVVLNGKSFKGRYQVDCCGNVWSLRREKIVNGRLYAWAGKQMKSFIDSNGYKYTSLSDGKLKIKAAIHTIVLQSFKNKPANAEVCRHLDGNPLNNCIWNLEWGSYKDNYEDSRKHGKNQQGERSSRSKLTQKQVKKILESKQNSFELSKKYKVASSTIRAIKTGQNWKSVTNMEVK